MAKRKRGRIVDGIVDGGGFDDDPSPGGIWFVTEDGTRLTPDEAFPAQDGPAVSTTPGGRRGVRRPSQALFLATVHYEHHVGIDVRRPVRETLTKIGQHAVKHGLDGCELISEDNGSQEESLGLVIAALKPPP